jgi:ABC-type multidrug transport system permease subunit
MTSYDEPTRREQQYRRSVNTYNTEITFIFSITYFFIYNIVFITIFMFFTIGPCNQETENFVTTKVFANQNDAMSGVETTNKTTNQ